jgi:hypothetical protein
MALELALAVQQEIESRLDEADRLRHRQVERAQYEADQARHRYMQVDPANRLVTDSLEADWNARLRALAAAHEEYQRQRAADRLAVDDEERKRILALATDFPAAWRDPKTPHRERKRMLALLVEDVTLLKQRQLTASVRFRGGATKWRWTFEIAGLRVGAGLTEGTRGWRRRRRPPQRGARPPRSGGTPSPAPASRHPRPVPRPPSSAAAWWATLEALAGDARRHRRDLARVARGPRRGPGTPRRGRAGNGTRWRVRRCLGESPRERPCPVTPWRSGGAGLELNAEAMKRYA